METCNARVVKEEPNHYIELSLKQGALKISMTEDVPNDVKSIFNQLIVQLKSEQFNFNLIELGNDLFSQIAAEYITQLNNELTTVYKELEHHELLNKNPILNDVNEPS